jgi:hypothetical protein
MNISEATATFLLIDHVLGKPCDAAEMREAITFLAGRARATLSAGPTGTEIAKALAAADLGQPANSTRTAEVR